MLVQQILSAKTDEGIVTVPPDVTVRSAVRVLAMKRIGTVVVSNDGIVPLGILSERDVMRELASQDVAVLEQPVSAIMTTRLVTCAPTDSARAIAEQMTQGRFRHMPVVENGAMVGIVSIGDVVKWRLSEVSMEKDALEGMIKGY